MALKLEPLYAKQAKDRQRLHAGTAPGKPKTLPQTSAEVTETRNEVAKQARVSRDTIAKAKVIAEKAPEPVKEKLRKGESTINKEFKAIVNAERQKQQVEQVRKFESEPREEPPDDLLASFTLFLLVGLPLLELRLDRSERNLVARQDDPQLRPFRSLP